MLLPIGDTPNPPGKPWVTYLLLAANIAVFILVTLPLSYAQPDLGDPLLLDYLRAMGARGAISAQAVLEQISAYDLLVFEYGYRPASPSLVALFSSLFLHAGWMHLAGNMLFLWIFGDNVEHRLGRISYLLAYIGAGVAATLFFAFFTSDSQIPLVGASGAISGVLGFYFLWFPRNRVRTFVFLFPIIMTTLMIPARWVLGFYLLVDNLLPFLISGGGAGSGVAHGAHIGGFLAGLGLAAGADRLPGAWRQHRERVLAPRSAEPGDGPEAVSRLVGEGEARRAAQLYAAIEGRQRRLQVPSAEVVAMGNALLSGKEYQGALSLFRRFIAERPNDPLLDRAYLGAGKAMIHLHRQITSAYHYFLAALDVTRSREVAEEARMHLRAIERLGER